MFDSMQRSHDGSVETWRERAAMSGMNHSDIKTLIAVIERSQIIVSDPPRRPCELPVGFERIDFDVLEWLADEGRRARFRALGVSPRT
jgi:hypothetical protein